MAIDTQEKRMNATKVGRPWMRSHYPTTIDQQWRIAVGNAYGGNELAETVATAGYICMENVSIAMPSGQFTIRQPTMNGTIITTPTMQAEIRNC